MEFKSNNGSVIKINYIIDGVSQELKDKEAVIKAEIAISVKSDVPNEKEPYENNLQSISNLL